jgi:hypothetical protein
MQEKFEQRLLRGPLGLHDAVGAGFELLQPRNGGELIRWVPGSGRRKIRPPGPNT